LQEKRSPYHQPLDLKTFKEMMDTNKPQRARDLAMKILTSLPEEIPDTDNDPEFDNVKVVQP
jgi:hypothetical protein